MKKVILMAMVCFIGFGAAKAQIKIDVKTKIENKTQLTVLKNALILMLKDNPNYKVVNTGEDYSLWIIGYRSGLYKGNYIVGSYLELRTASFFTRGDLVKKIISQKRYNPNDLSGANNLSMQELSQKLGQLQGFKDLYVKAIGKSVQGGGTYAAMSGIPIGGLLNKLFEKWKSLVNQGEFLNPSNAEKAKTVIMSTQIMTNLNSYFY